MINAVASVRESWQDIFSEWNGEILKIAYFGNSVTVQKNGYRPKLHELILGFTGNAHVMVNAGIGGVGSVASNFLCEDLVVRHQPRVCFIETSLADSGGVNPFSLIEPSLRGIVHKLKAIHCKICFLHLCRADVLSREEISKIRAVYEMIEEEFQVNSIELSLRPETQPEGLLTDGVHTHEAGAEIYAENIFKCIRLFKNTKSAFTVKLEHEDKPSLRYTGILRDYMGEKYPVKLFKLSVPFLEIPADESYGITLPEVHCIGLLLIADEDCGKLIIENDKLKKEFTILDQWCYQPRIQSVFWDETAGPGETLYFRTENAANLKLIGLLCYGETPFDGSHTLFISHGK